MSDRIFQRIVDGLAIIFLIGGAAIIISWVATQPDYSHPQQHSTKP